MSRHLSTRKISSKSIATCCRVICNLANRQTDSQTNATDRIYVLRAMSDYMTESEALLLCRLYFDSSVGGEASYGDTGTIQGFIFGRRKAASGLLR